MRWGVSYIRVKNQRMKGLNHNVLVPTLNWVIEDRLMVLELLTQPSNRKQFGSRRKGPLKKGWR